MVCVSWLEFGLTDALVNFICIILCRLCYICLALNVITEKLVVYEAFGFVYTVTCSSLSWWLWFVTVLLCTSILDFMFGIQLKQIFILFLLNIFENLCCGGKCLSTNFRKKRPTFVDTFILQEGLNQIIFLFRCCFEVSFEVFFLVF